MPRSRHPAKRPPSYARRVMHPPQHKFVAGILHSRKAACEGNPFDKQQWKDTCHAFSLSFAKDFNQFNQTAFLEDCGLPAKKKEDDK